MRTLKFAMESIRRAKLRFDPRIETHRVPDWRAADGQRLRVAVVGAGMSGLVAAILLRELGHATVVFEARERPGGRVHTLKLSESLHAEAGAARVSDQHTHTLHWLGLAGLNTRSFYPPMGRLVCLRHGHRYLSRDVAEVSADAVHHLISGGLSWESHFGLTKRQLVSDSLIKSNWLGVAGGLAGLPRALAKALGDDIRFDTPVESIRINEASVEIGCRGMVAGGSFDAVVLTAPLAVYDQIEFTPRLPDRRLEIMASCGAQPSLRVFLVCRNGRWLSNGLNGWGRMNDGLELWRESDFIDADRSVLTVYGQGDSVRALVGQSRQRRHSEVVSLLERAFEGVTQHIEFVDSYCWSDDAWARGAQTTARPIAGQLLELQSPMGRLHFAGEHTASDGWIDGAIASAYRVVTEICGLRPHTTGDRRTRAGRHQSGWDGVRRDVPSIGIRRRP